MKDELVDIFVEQLESIIETGRSEVNIRDANSAFQREIITLSAAACSRITGQNSTYSQQIRVALDSTPSLSYQAVQIYGVTKALLKDLKLGYLKSIEEIIHANIFADFLEMANHLQSDGFKDAAAVITGSSLEAHLRQLCIKNGIDTDVTTSSGNLKAKTADRMNADLAKAGAYDKDKLDQKSVTAWLDLRNKAAHGKYTEYETVQVSLMTAGVSDFIVRNPA